MHVAESQTIWWFVYYQGLTYESWFTNLKQMPLNLTNN